MRIGDYMQTLEKILSIYDYKHKLSKEYIKEKRREYKSPRMLAMYLIMQRRDLLEHQGRKSKK